MPSCDSFFKDLVQCLLKSDCVAVERHTVKECLDVKYDESVSRECRVKQQAYKECKLNLLNPRKRFRGSYGGTMKSEEYEEE